MKIYEVDDFKPFRMHEVWSRICLQSWMKTSEILSQSNLFIASKDQLLHNVEFLLIPNSLLETQQLFLGKFSQSCSTRQINERFRFVLIEEELRHFDLFLKWIHSHLSHRDSQAQKIAKIESIKLRFAEIQGNRSYLQSVFENSTEFYGPHFTSHFRELMMSLAQLAGGRAFLQGNIIEMLWFFEILNQIYMVA